MNEEQIFLLKVWLGLGRLFGSFQGGLLGTIFIVWLTGVLGQAGLSAINMMSSVVAMVIMIIFSSKMGIEIACRYPYWTVWIMHAGCLISSCVMLAGFNPWVILTVEATIAFIMESGFMQTRKAMLHRKIYGDTLTKMNNQLDIISTVCYLLGTGLAIIIPATIDVIGISILIASTFLLPINIMQLRVLISMPDIKKVSTE